MCSGIYTIYTQVACGKARAEASARPCLNRDAWQSTYDTYVYELDENGFGETAGGENQNRRNLSIADHRLRTGKRCGSSHESRILQVPLLSNFPSAITLATLSAFLYGSLICLSPFALYSSSSPNEDPIASQKLWPRLLALPGFNVLFSTPVHVALMPGPGKKWWRVAIRPACAQFAI